MSNKKVDIHLVLKIYTTVLVLLVILMVVGGAFGLRDSRKMSHLMITTTGIIYFGSVFHIIKKIFILKKSIATGNYHYVVFENKFIDILFWILAVLTFVFGLVNENIFKLFLIFLLPVMVQKIRRAFRLK